MSISREQMETIASMLADAIRAATAGSNSSASAPLTQISSKAPQFSISEYRGTDGANVTDYFTRFDWALQLSGVEEADHANYVRVHMGTQLNSALKFLISPRQPDELTYPEIKNTLIAHFDGRRNKFAESVKFRALKQEPGESIANFTLRLKQGAVFCDYGAFLDRMLIEQLLLGLESAAICDELIAKKPSTFSEAYELAYSRELTHSATRDVNTSDMPHSEQTCRLGFAPVKTKGNKDHLPQGKNALCFGCGGKHTRAECKFRPAKCFACSKMGHIARVCRNVTRQVTIEEENNDFMEQLNKVNRSDKAAVDRKLIDVLINGKCVPMVLDTGAPCSIISRKNLCAIKKKWNLISADRKFISYTGHKINCVGRVTVKVTIGKTTRLLNLYVVEDDLDTLCGRERISHFTREINFVDIFAPTGTVSFSDGDSQLSLNAINNIVSNACVLSSSEKQQLQQIIERHKAVFGESAGKLIGPPVRVHLKDNATPVFARAREVPLALREAYAREIDKKIAAGVYERVEFSEWASTTHVVTKKNGGLRITGNYKPTVNSQIIVDEHPIPKAEDLFNRMRGATIFAHLDVTDAYTQTLTLNTITHGLIRPRRAVYGAANIPAVWQRKMESIIQGIPNVLNFFDDFLIFAANFKQLIDILEITLKRMEECGLKLSKNKCIFAARSVEFLGHLIDGKGIHKSSKHVEAILKAPKPSTVEQLQLFLGKAAYYNAFIPDLSTRERPLREMLRAKTIVWSSKADKAYNEIKELLVLPQVLMPYNPELPLLLATDASNVGLGAVLSSHRLENGQERPIAYASRAMSTTECKYPQMDKEALAIIWAVQKFFKYLYARTWTLITDHKPLSQILQPDKTLPTLCISRMANYADFLNNFTFDVIYRSSKQNANADYLSRVTPKCFSNTPFKVNSSYTDRDEFDSFIIKQVVQLPVAASRIELETRKDFELRKIVQLLEKGCCLLKYGYKSPEANYKLSGGCLVFEHRVVIPGKLRADVLRSLHAAHLGIVKMKGIARSFVYWPRIDVDIERMAKECDKCLRIANKPKVYAEHHWEYPSAPWERAHMDYAGPIDGAMLLIITYAFSKWLEVKVTKSVTAAATIALIDEVFAAYGVPRMVVSDNGTNFSSKEFNDYLTNVGVKYHKYTAPYHPATNGQAERSVQTVKNALKAMGSTAQTLKQNLNEFLRQYKNALHSTTNIPPARLFLERQLRTRLDLVRPEHVSDKVVAKQLLKSSPDCRVFEIGDSVYFFPGNGYNAPWERGTILRRIGDLYYEIRYGSRVLKRHVNQIRRGYDKGDGERAERTYPGKASRSYPGMEAIRTEGALQAIEGTPTTEQGIQPMQRCEGNNLPVNIESPANNTSSGGSTSTLMGFETPPSEMLQTEDEVEHGTGHQDNGRSFPAPRRSTRLRKRRVLFSP